MATFARSFLRTVIPLVLAKLQGVSGLPEERCFAGQVDDPPDTQAEQYFVVEFAGAPSADQATWLGAGPIDSRLHLAVSVLVRTRHVRDEVGHSIVWLTDEDDGHLLYVDYVFEAFWGRTVKDAGNNDLTLPGEFAGWTTPAKARKPRTAAGMGWEQSIVRFRFPIEQDLDQTRLLE